MEQQRSLIQKEKQRTANSLMVFQRKKRHEELEEKAAAAVEFSHKKAREEIDALKATIHKQKIVRPPNGIM